MTPDTTEAVAVAIHTHSCGIPDMCALSYGASDKVFARAAIKADRKALADAGYVIVRKEDTADAYREQRYQTMHDHQAQVTE